MKYDTGELMERALNVIEDEKLCFIEDVAASLGISKTTFYEHGLNEMDAIKSAIINNKIAKKKKLRNKWEDSDNATLNIALYRLLADDDELVRLSKQHVDVTSKDEKIEGFNYVIPSEADNTTNS